MAPLRLRPIRVEGNVAYITLTNNCEAIIDAEDAALFGRLNWYAWARPHTTYAVRSARDNEPGPRMVFLHRAVLSAPHGISVDHINGDGLDNRRANLRLASLSENNRNQRLAARNTSGFKGVTWHARQQRWQAQIKSGGKCFYLGLFDNRQEAHAAYCDAAKRMHGEFARTA